MFKWYDIQTKLVLLEFYRDLIEEGSLTSSIEDYSSFSSKNFLGLMKDLTKEKSNQETYILNLLAAALKAKE